MLTCYIIDDEPLAIKLLEDHISKIQYLKLLGSHTNPLEALTFFEKHKVDLVFLDIQMPQLNGLQFMKLLQNRSQVIITSAYQEYAIEGFENDVVDYLLKPILFERFYRAVQKAYKLKNPTENIPVPNEALATNGGYIFVKVENKMIRVELDDILFIEGQKNYVYINTKANRLMSLQIMKQLEEILPANRFVRVHKSYIIALDKITSIQRQEILIKDRIIPIGATYAEHFTKILQKRKA